MSKHRLLPALLPCLVLMAAGAARAEAASDAPIAATTPPPASVAQQIDAYLKTSPAIALPKDDALGVTSGEEARKMHGEVSVAVGTGGYRSVYARTDMPVGKTGTLSVAVADSRSNGGRFGGGRFGAGGGRSLGLSYMSEDATASGERRCGTDFDGRRQVDPAFMGDEYRRACGSRIVPRLDD